MKIQNPNQQKSQLEDERLIASALQGVQSAFARLYNKYHSYVRGVVYNVIKWQQDIDDATQEAFIKVFTQLNKYDSKQGEFKMWLATVSNRSCVDYLRGRKSPYRPDRINTSELKPYYMGESPYPKMDSIELERIIDKELDRTCPDQAKRAVIEMAIKDGRGLESLAKSIGKTHEWIRTQSFRRRANIQAAIKVAYATPF